MDTMSEVAVDGIAKAVTVGGEVSGKVTVTGAPMLAETLAAASLAQAYRVLLPSDVNV